MEARVGDRVIQIDEQDAWLLEHARPDASGYITVSVGGFRERLHRVVMQAQKGQHVDHVSRDKNDYRRGNLRFATQAENGCNKAPYKNNRSGYKGVYLCSSTGRWRAEIRFNYERIKIGRFDSPQEAARAYDEKAIELHGEFAVTNKELDLLIE